MIHYGCIPPNDKLNIRLFGLLRMYLGIFTLGTIQQCCAISQIFFVSFVLDETQYIHLITYPLLDGTNAHTLPKDIWDWRAKDEENMDEYHIYHFCKFMLKRGEKENQVTKIEIPKKNQ